MIISAKCMEPGLAWRLAGESCNTVAVFLQSQQAGACPTCAPGPRVPLLILYQLFITWCTCLVLPEPAWALKT